VSNSLFLEAGRLLLHESLEAAGLEQLRRLTGRQGRPLRGVVADHLGDRTVHADQIGTPRLLPLDHNVSAWRLGL